MTVESSLTHALNIRFIDARSLATEAKLKLGLFGYPGSAQEQLIIEEAMRIFLEERPAQFQNICRQQKQDLDLMKMMRDDSNSTLNSSCEFSVDKSTRSSGESKRWGFFRKTVSEPISKFV